MLADSIEQLPSLLRGQVEEWLSQARAQLVVAEDVIERTRLPAVWAASEFVARSCLREPALLEDLLAAVEQPDKPGDMRSRLQSRLEGVGDADALARQLRRFRLREIVRIAWRDLAGWALLEETLNDLSELADVCVDEALSRLYRWQCQQWGVPRNEQGESQQLVVFGMGKLGGRELNFSSDIDLIFMFPETGVTDGARGKSNEEFFAALGRKLIAALDAPTADGFVFRVDMRLRPYGNSGPLAMSANAMELYYQSQGREWERYAMIKARVIAGDRTRGEQMLDTLRPFVYRRYLDYGALESLREMKEMIVREVARRGMENNIKLGRGGIREIEFTGQAFQLIRGGRDPKLRQRSILPVLRHLGAEGLLPSYAADDLIAAYDFLRRTENRLQAMDDRQTHSLPTDPVEQARLAFAMGCRDWSDFSKQLDGWRRKVQSQFDQVFVAPQAEGDATPAAAGGSDLGDVWLTDMDDEHAQAALASAGYHDAADGWRRLSAFKSGSACRSLSANGRRRLDHLMPLLLAAAVRTSRPDAALARLLEVVEAIARRTAYLALLVENPMALSQLVQLCAASPWIARYLARHPLLLDELLDPRTLYQPLGKEALQRELAARLSTVAEDDLEQQMEVLRQFKHTNTLRVATADITGAVPLMVVSDYLTYLAETTLEAVLKLAYRQMTARHRKQAGPTDEASGIAIIAYGKLGGIELGYGSDLDLVFIHQDTGDLADDQVFFGRVTQRVIHILGTATPGGILYEADTRLRPSGKGGLLSITLPAFAEYQRSNAWTWEHQALVRARPVAGDPQLCAGFEQVRAEMLRRARDRETLRREVRDMRSRQLAEKGSKESTWFDLKNDRGGIADIEFLVQYGVLSRATDHPGLVRYTDNIRLLDELSDTGWISADEARLLADAYRGFRSRLHRLALQEEPGRVPSAEFVEQRAFVADMWQRLME